MAYGSKEWWNEFALFLAITFASIFVLASLVAIFLNVQAESVSGLIVIVPSVFIGLAAARIHRRRHGHR
ncbi:hypothetical protein OG242_12650 [Streptomyces sp. NBC_00727]|uniref:hypothetical protein n=1 Tax=Streptomyces sp. NBC_00727 TaxID=2903675 RepID=UPI00386BAA03